MALSYCERKKERKMNFEKPATRATVHYINGKKLYRNGCTITLKGKNQRILWKKIITLLAPTAWLPNIGAAVSDKLYLLADFVFCKQFCVWHFFADFIARCEGLLQAHFFACIKKEHIKCLPAAPYQHQQQYALCFRTKYIELLFL